MGVEGHKRLQKWAIIQPTDPHLNLPQLYLQTECRLKKNHKKIGEKKHLGYGIHLKTPTCGIDDPFRERKAKSDNVIICCKQCAVIYSNKGSLWC